MCWLSNDTCKCNYEHLQFSSPRLSEPSQAILNGLASNCWTSVAFWNRGICSTASNRSIYSSNALLLHNVHDTNMHAVVLDVLRWVKKILLGTIIFQFMSQRSFSIISASSQLRRIPRSDEPQDRVRECERMLQDIIEKFDVDNSGLSPNNEINYSLTSYSTVAT